MIFSYFKLRSNHLYNMFFLAKGILAQLPIYARNEWPNIEASKLKLRQHYQCRGLLFIEFIGIFVLEAKRSLSKEQIRLKLSQAVSYILNSTLETVW